MAVPRLVGIPELMVPLAEVDVECDDAASCHARNDCPEEKTTASTLKMNDGGKMLESGSFQDKELEPLTTKNTPSSFSQL